mmetsp:Transcript_29812/g.45479  ORF Transcript_29812/g.45479 Transcript_29812/m.45479 type:complete len:201 (-) Transcript_29812:42-644(-)
MHQLKPILKSLFKGTGVRIPENSLEAFQANLSEFKEFQNLTPLEQVLLFEYYQEKLKQKDRHRKEKVARVKDEVQHDLKAVINLDKASDSQVYLEDFKRLVDKIDHDKATSFSEAEALEIISEVVKYLQTKREKQHRQRKKHSPSPSKSKRSDSDLEQGEIPSQQQKSERSTSRKRRRSGSEQSHGPHHQPRSSRSRSRR